MHLFNFNLFLLFWDQQAWNSSLQSSCLSLLNAGLSGTCHHAWPVCSFKSCRTARVPCRHTLDHDSYCDGIEGYRRIFLNVQLQVIPNGKNWHSLFKLEWTKEKNSIEGKEYLLFWKGKRCIIKHKNKICRAEKHLSLTNKQKPLIGRGNLGHLELRTHHTDTETIQWTALAGEIRKAKFTKVVLPMISPLTCNYILMHKIAKITVLCFPSWA